MKCNGAISALMLLAVCGDVYAGPPQARISNGPIEAALYLPDAGNGYYRGTRFDWAGLISELKYAGHGYFGEWFLERNPYDPYTHDSVVGPAEVFDAIGYDEAAAGGEFLVIGVGGLRKPQRNRYNSFILHEITNPGKWTVVKSRGRVSFTHEVEDAAGYSYVYTKTVRLADGEPRLVIEHSLKNTGQKAIATQCYGHNFFGIDGSRTGPGLIVEFPFEIEGRWQKDNGLAVVDGRRITYTRDFASKDEVYMGDMRGYGPRAEGFYFRIENTVTGAGVRMTCDRPVAKLVLWACYSVSCPEVFIDVAAAPGEEFRWTNTYEFYTLD